MSLASDSMTLAAKDLRVEARSRDALASGIALGAIALLIVGLAAGPDPVRLRSLAPGLIWVALLFAVVSSADRLEQVDRRDDAFSALWLALADRRSIYLGRILSLSVVLTTLQLSLWGMAIVLFDVAPGMVLLVLFPLAILTSLCMATATAIVAALVAGAPQRILLLPVLLLPLLIPTLLAGVQASGALVDARPSDAVGWVLLLGVQIALFGGAGLLTYESAAAPE